MSRHHDLLGAIVRCDGELMEVIGISTDPQAVLRPVADEDRDTACPTCGQRREEHIVIGSALWLDKVKPVKTIGGEQQ